MKEMDIGEVARRCGLPSSTLRYYEEKGLIRSIGRRGLSRVFAADVLERLSLITLGQSAAFSLDDIATMLDADGQPAIDHQRLAEKADELDRTIQQLSAIRDGLRRAAACPAARHIECANFQKILSAVKTGSVRRNPSNRSQSHLKTAKIKGGRTP
ncbi:MerR family transcriptional regulator [Pseudomonas fluorescens]|jgi:DNA-binding transcriptional MerR regulator|uniref:helix-turn-helix domain-containing protein n=1 Tax=Pseudomonas TaxID=286 RepID=UPI00070CCC80|nr:MULTISPECIES: helix-turn-helix domain-containing protein [Pseudomonas]AYG08522.1 MerR family transcriptional regulator [Pseudomonas fluorescens]MBJ2270946.1 helix-turn-helix domain-containing protein [Pseudomonas sp. MF6772]MBL7231015.1 helix-turn-helix domain-containing protein [Pseudomonas sp.]MCU0209405.1 helix-turn-helix domain-containing protein [Pseudomonas shahriarae]NMY19263.1 helix-turn-helix domain-containing protein [Pseudomonas sp. WS 5410]